jgi:flagellar export protein FliJ
MPKFTFRLETLLKLRESDRDQCRARLQQAEEAVAVLEDQASELQQQVEQTAGEASSAASPGEIDVDSLVEFRRYGLLLQVQLRQLASQQELVQQEVTRRREELTEADRQVKVLEKLKEHRRAEHVSREHYAEIKQLDEVAQRCGGRQEHTS